MKDLLMRKRLPAAARIGTLIGRAVNVHGDVDFEGGLHLDGRIGGDVRSDAAPGATLEVSESGAIEGAVRVPNILLKGSVRGDIHASGRVVLAATARVAGNVYYGVIEIATGAQILGKLVQLTPTDAPLPANGGVAR